MGKVPVQDEGGTRPRRVEIIAGAVFMAFVGLWAILFLDKVLMPALTLQGVERTVPNLRKLPFAVADSLCRTMEMTLVAGRTRKDARLVPGTILDQFPGPGARVKPGKKVEAAVSGAVDMVVCPDLTGCSPQDAALRAAEYGLVVFPSDVSHAHSSSAPEGVVIGQTPPPGSMLPPGAKLRLTVSLGEAPERIVAPDLVGRRLDGVRLLLAKYSLHLGEIDPYPESSVAEGTVLSQSPPPGTPLSAGESVSVRVAVSPAASPVDTSTR